MRVRTVVAVASFALFAVSASRAQQKPNLTDTWKMNLEKSKLSDGKPILYYSECLHEIDHKEPRLRLVEKIKTPGGESDRTVVWDLTVDGKETETNVSGSPAKTSAKWEGNRLITRIAGEGWTVVRKSTMALTASQSPPNGNSKPQTAPREPVV